MRCRACQQEHSPLLTCSRAARIAAFEAERAVPALLKPKLAPPPVSAEPEPVSASRSSHKTREERNAYQREYMKRKRAEAKAAGGVK